jgi:hypothetical protein
MKQYPSILNCTGKNFTEFQAMVWDKKDGSNLRFEWSKKAGWHKFGTRQQLLDPNDPVFGCAIPLFLNFYGENIAKIAENNRWTEIIVFAEFWGKNSFAGQHEPSDEKHITPFDVAIYKKGILGPKEFLKLFGHLDIAPYLGQFNWNRSFIEKVRNGELEGITFEGVVGKAGEGHKLIMRKIKTQAWKDAVLARYGAEKGQQIIES